MNSEFKTQKSSLDYMSAPLPAPTVHTNKFDEEHLKNIHSCIETKMEGSLINHITTDLKHDNKISNGIYYKINKDSIIYDEKQDDIEKAIGGEVLSLMEQYRKEYAIINAKNIASKDSEKIDMAVKMLKAQGLPKEIIQNFLKSIGKTGMKTWEKYTETNKCLTLSKIVKTKLTDDKFSEVINSNKFQLPIANKKVIDLEYSKPYVRERGMPFSIQSCLGHDEKNKNPKQIGDYFSYVLDFNYVPRTESNKKDFEFIDQFILDLATGNEDKAKFLKTVLGSILIKGNPSQKFFLFTGTGSNGKSLLMNLINFIFNELRVEINPELIINNKGQLKEPGSGADPFLMELNNPKNRLLILSETKEGITFNDTVIKRLTGGDNFKARLLHSNKCHEFSIDSKLIVVSNHRPKFNVYDYGMKRRPNAVDFNSTFVKEPKKKGEYKKDPDLFNKLTKNRDVLFSWFVECAFLYKDNMNFDAPEIIQKETENYFYELDSVSQYIDPSSEHVIITNNDKDKIQQSDLFEDYVNFCKQNNLTFTKKSNFYSTLSKKFTKKKVRGYIHFCGLKWPDDDDDDDCEKLL